MKKRRIILIAVGLIAAAVVAFLVWPGEKEPVYQGKKLSEWLARYPWAGNHRERVEAANAVRQIGSNAIPCLLKWMDYDDPAAWKMRLWRSAAKYRRVVDSKVFRRLMHLPGNGRDALAAVQGFQILGPRAKDAIPAVSQLMNDTTPGGKGGRAVLVLSYIGRDALPVLLSALSNEAQTNRYWIAWCIGTMRDLGTNADSAVPTLLRCMRGTNKELAGAAATALGNLHPMPELVIPALRQASRDSDEYLRHAAIMAIGEYGALARSAIPELLEAAKQPGGVHYAAESALRRVAPELLPPEDRVELE